MVTKGTKGQGVIALAGRLPALARPADIAGRLVAEFNAGQHGPVPWLPVALAIGIGGYFALSRRLPPCWRSPA